MKKFQFDITVEAENEGEATKKMKAAAMLLKKLTAKEIEKMADVVANDPVKTKLAKAYLGL